MSTYNGRRGPNVSQYLRDLNTISPQDTTGDDSFNMEENLSFFTNTQFFDLDSGQNTDFQAPPPVKPDAVATPAPSTTEDPASVMGDISNMDFMNGEFNFSDFNAYQAPSISAFATADSPHDFRPLQPSHGPVYGNEVHPPQQHAQFAQSSARTGEKRKAEGTTPPSRSASSMEEASRLAAEEDKRRRNTAASARFRIKKKQREQALEKTAKEMGEKVSTLESRVTQLETENRWLKSLLTEKNEGTEDITALWKEFTKQAGKRGTLEAAKEDR
ncbi:Regulatory protein cys-like protein [Hapsidospora chrysogenum ATCC 11550]|uniref:Regulatory protein cys-like protein n=1 Tax=Hapsidospora chrysogenum (strain ATCC 11550 / CBS 779.69 / DSM 880 / IAM 14645 / JCM 23072 / IMI 49137) TaxID=857340 RepID=A0A086T621_HAPC1|nr:Regulatory protein cys-like protein [Hapsidospora chrysogenum ATCC 11550]